MEIANNNNSQRNNEYFQSNINHDSNSDKTLTVSTKDNISVDITNTNFNPVQSSIPIVKQDFLVLCQLVSKERQVLSESSKPSNKPSKPSFKDIKNNVQVIQHNIDNFFSIQGKKTLIRMKKDE